MRAGRNAANGSNKKVFMHRSFRHPSHCAALFLLTLPPARKPNSPSRSSAAPARPSPSRSCRSTASRRARPAFPTSSAPTSTRSGLFKLVDPTGVVPRPARIEDVQAAAWRAKGADAVVVGSTRPLADGRVEVRFALVDVVKQAPLVAMVYTVTPAQFRATAHKIADVIYEKMTGDPGVFSTRIAYITKQGTRFQLLVADADGFEPQTIVTSNEPMLSPRWSPDGTRIAYVSFESKKPVVYVQNLATGARAAVANFRGSNSSPAWSPDGRTLAVTLTKDGGSQLYLMNADGSNPQRVMSSPGHRHRSACSCPTASRCCSRPIAAAVRRSTA